MAQSIPEVTSIYTDGACSGNPGPGGWGAIAYLSNGQVHEIGGAVRETTNNRMELQAAIEILQWLATSPQTTSPTLYTDSKYVQDGITKWIKGWKKKQWKTSAGKPVLNQDLWQQLDAATQTVNAQLEAPVRWQYVKGHAGNTGNERCDAIARSFSLGQYPTLSKITPWDQIPAHSEGTTPIPYRNEQERDEQERDGHETDDHETDGVTDARISRAIPATTPKTRSNAPSHSNKNESDRYDPKENTITMSKTVKSPEYDADSNPSLGEIASTHLAAANLGTNTHPTALRQMIERLRVADELASHGYWVTTAELADVVELSPSTINSKGDRWIWRNWSIMRVQQDSNSILWRLSRID